MTEQIVIGYDGSENSDRALDWAIQEARARSGELQVVVATGRSLDLDPSPYWDFLVSVDEEANKSAGRAVTRAQEHGVAAVGVVAHGGAAGVLVERSATAQALVVGKRGRRGVGGRVGSVSAAVAAHAKCPVVVLPAHWKPQPREVPIGLTPFTGRVVVGVDRLGVDHPASGVAAHHANRHNQGLAVLTVIPEPTTTSTRSLDLDRAIREQLLGPAQAMVEQVAEKVRVQYPNLSVETYVLSGRPTHKLVEASRSAELTVVGSRGYGGFRGLLLGSVSQALLHDGESPVMVVPTRARD